MNWKWWRTYVLNIETLGILIIVALALYFIFTVKKRKFKFQGLGDEAATLGRKKKKRKKYGKTEQRCREIFEDIYGVPFRTIRPKWLKNPVTKKNLELDGYNPDISTPIGQGLAFEFDGAQHSKYTKHFHKHGVDEFKYQVKKDSFKDLKCKERGVLLIRVPHFVAVNDLERYIRNKLEKEKVLPRRSGGMYG